MSETQISAAVRAMESGRWREARRLLGQIVQTDPNNADAWWNLAHATEDPAQKAHCLRQVVRLRPEHSEARRQLAELDRRVTPGRSAHTLKRQVIDTVENDEGLIAEPPPVTQAHPSLAAPAKSPKRTGWVAAAALAIVMLVGIAGVAALVVFRGGFILGGGEVTIIAPTSPALSLTVRECTASGSGSAALVFSNQTDMDIDLLRGTPDAEVLLATLPPGGEFSVQVQPEVQIRYVARSAAEPGWNAGGAVIELPPSSTCRVVIK